MMAATRRDPDEPTTPLAAVTKWAIQLGVLGALVAVVGALMWLVFEMSSQNQLTSKQLVDVTATAVDKLPMIAAEMRDDNRRDGEFMREHTARAVTARDQLAVQITSINTRLTAIDAILAEIRSEQQLSSRAMMEAVQRLLTYLESLPKNARPSPVSGQTGDGSNG